MYFGHTFQNSSKTTVTRARLWIVFGSMNTSEFKQNYRYAIMMWMVFNFMNISKLKQNDRQARKQINVSQFKQNYRYARKQTQPMCF